ncbi:SDR family NAD(P)-dependent oxidoreductase [Brevundimonas goettingensis]|uniref:SDR family oxidoreductase n=1 Tax=Brevundimonas goettingensis TaxID=2774190 RepID=A0A975C2N2_9CAUL|nr:SDR family oxidoreductase [Brevundimonas goettingensis]QTC91949.1 SDR family oxidoreductase [Brevundimonas goettingensis]
MAGRLAHKVAIITGASRGLGAWCAEGFGAEGAAVVIAARSKGEEPHTLAHTAGRVEAAGGVAFPVICDVADPASIQAMVDAVLDRFGRVDILMTNAVYYAPGSFSTISAEDWERQFRVNVHGVFHAIRAVLPSMIQNRSGNIITVSSVAAERISHYGATKRAVAGMTVGFAEEQRENGIAVNALRPVAAIRTPGWEESRPAEVLQTRAHRVSPPDSYVEAAVLLAMRTSAECTGQALTDAEVINRFGAPESLGHFKAMNAPVWSEGL